MPCRAPLLLRLLTLQEAQAKAATKDLVALAASDPSLPPEVAQARGLGQALVCCCLTCHRHFYLPELEAMTVHLVNFFALAEAGLWGQACEDAHTRHF